MDKREKAQERAKCAMIALLIAMECPNRPDHEKRRELAYQWEEKKYAELVKTMHYNLEHSPYRNSVLMEHLVAHALWCVEETENVKVRDRRQRELVHA